MPQVIIDYEKPETLKLLKGLAKDWNFKITTALQKGSSPDDILVKGDSSIVPDDLSDIFLGRGLDAKKLRETAWQRKR